MNTPRQLLHGLLEYIAEQTKNIDPKGFRLSGSNGFVCRPEDIAGLPGVDLDVQLDGDHTWLRIARLEATIPPAIPEDKTGLIRLVTDPSKEPPSINENALKFRIGRLHENDGLEAIEDAEKQLRNQLGRYSGGLSSAMAYLG